MKKIFVYRIVSNRIWNILKIKLYQYLGYKALVWGDQNLPIHDLKSIKFPSAKKSIEFEKNSRRLSSEFFNRFHKDWSEDPHRMDYIRKTIDMYSLDYYAFERTILQLTLKDDKVKKITPRFISAVYENRRPSMNYSIIFFYPISIIKLTMIFVKNLALGLSLKSNVSIPMVLYFRKKIEPDNGECEKLSQVLNSNNRKLILGIFPFFSRKHEKFGFYFINSFKGNLKRQIQSFTGSIVLSFSDFIFYFTRGVDESILSKCLYDTYIAKSVTSLSPSIICGVLVDKPLYVLINKYKKQHTKMLSLNESFFFPPNRSFDFNYLDQYYSMNEIDERMQNIYGGDIKSFKRVEFFRKGGGGSKGLSSELLLALNSFSYKIIIAPAQVNVEKSGYYYWAYNEMEEFIQISLDLAKNFQDTLFIIKGKKGELRFLPKWLNELIQNSNNIFVIQCENPKELEYNKFEDLIDIADLVISMALTSTTIWQTISRNKPAIAINRFNVASPLSDFKGFESDLEGLNDQINYWRSLSLNDIHQSTEVMKKFFNIGSSNGLNEIAEDLIRHLNLK
jgi:hypothetical protein